jgi:ATP-binding cassette, subfamily G (WHITE), eye pigment precursor transporter
MSNQVHSPDITPVGHTDRQQLLQQHNDQNKMK